MKAVQCTSTPQSSVNNLTIITSGLSLAEFHIRFDSDQSDFVWYVLIRTVQQHGCQYITDRFTMSFLSSNCPNYFFKHEIYCHNCADLLNNYDDSLALR